MSNNWFEPATPVAVTDTAPIDLVINALVDLVWFRYQVVEHKGQDTVTVTVEWVRWHAAQDAVADLVQCMAISDPWTLDLVKLVTHPRKVVGVNARRVRITWRDTDWSAARRATKELRDYRESGREQA